MEIFTIPNYQKLYDNCISIITRELMSGNFGQLYEGCYITDAEQLIVSPLAEIRQALDVIEMRIVFCINTSQTELDKYVFTATTTPGNYESMTFSILKSEE